MARECDLLDEPPRRLQEDPDPPRPELHELRINRGNPGELKIEAFSFVEDWNRKKPGHEELFPHIDKNWDNKISLDEHQAF